MNQYRTDLAIECQEILDESAGIQMEKIEYNGGIRVTRIKIVSQEAAKKMGKPVGSYITLEADGVLEEEDGIKEKTAKAVAGELGQLLRVDYTLKVLVAGLGNSLVTPDRLGPETAAKVRVTRHLFVIFDADGDEEMSNVSCIIPGVTGSTGMETAEVIKKAAEIVKPDVVIVIDSLAARGYRQSQHDDPADGHGDPAGKRPWATTEPASMKRTLGSLCLRSAFPRS